MITPLTCYDLQHYVDLLAKREPFGIARYGDAEWLIILGGHIGMRNSHGSTFTQALSDDLRRVLKNAYSYEHAILRIAMRKLAPEIKRFLKRHRIKIEWTLGDTMLDVSLKGKLFPLVEQLRERRVLYVGPKHCRGLGQIGFFDYVGYVQPPPQDAHAKKNELVSAIVEDVQRHDADLVGFSSGLAAKVLIDDVWAITGGEVTLIDFGSMWDGYFGVKSRRYIQRGKNDFEKLLKLNTGRE